MRLLIDAHCFDYQTSEGINTYLAGIYNELIKLSIDIEFYFIASNIEKLKVIFGVHKNVHYISLKSTNKIIRLFIEIPTLIRKYKIDYAHFQYIAPLIKNCKTIITLHDLLFLDYPQYFPLSYRLTKKILFQFSAKRADILLTVSKYSKEKISEHFNIPLNKIFITPNAVSKEYAEVNKIEARIFTNKKGIDKYILYVSRLEPRKNHIQVLKSFCDLELFKKGYDLVFIGRKTISTPEVDNYLNSLPQDYKNHIFFFNQVPHHELLYWYKAASLFIYPSVAEGFGIPPLEAAVSGIPCICSNKTAMQEYSFFKQGHIDIDNEELLNKIIPHMLDNYKEVEEIKEIVLNRYDWKASAKFLFEILQNHKKHLLI